MQKLFSLMNSDSRFATVFCVKTAAYCN